MSDVDPLKQAHEDLKQAQDYLESVRLEFKAFIAG